MKHILLILFISLIFSPLFLFSEQPDWEPISGTQFSMVVIADIYLHSNPFIGSDTSNIAAAFGPGGDDDCRSLGAWQPDYPPYWDGYWYFTIVGNTNGESISFKIYNSLTDSIYACIQTIVFEDGSTIGNPYTPFLITTEPVSVDHQNSQSGDFLAYPNPFYENITFCFSSLQSDELSLKLYDIKGRYVAGLSSLISINNSISISIHDLIDHELIPGVYLCSFSSRGNIYTGKIVYIKD